LVDRLVDDISAAIVRGDDDLLVLEQVGEIPILSPADLLARIEKRDSEDSQE
jgi:predicted nucleic acid-binding protein